MIIGFCNPLLDLTVNVSDDFLQRHALNANDAILAGLEHAALLNELSTVQAGSAVEGVLSAEPLLSAGGSGQNAMRATKFMLGEKGVAVAFVGSVGKDGNAERLRDIAEREDHLQTHYDSSSSKPTGTCWCLVTPGHRSLVASLNAANDYSSAHYHSIKSTIFQCASIVYISGFFCTVNRDVILDVVASKNPQFILATNFSATFLCDFFEDVQAPLLRASDYVFGNEHEVRHYAIKHKLSAENEDMKTVALAVHKDLFGQSSSCLVVTQGSHETLVVEGCGSLSSHPVSRIDDVIDTNGAGDCFVGAFLSGVSQKLPLAECVQRGHWLAQQIIRRPGISFHGIPSYPSQ